ncbi:MAG: galactokinase [Acidobacteria bacterium]|nr:galactokinase [Acidobacteriota bacterium]
MIDQAELSAEFEARFGRRPRIFSAPGRVNLIGEHTDYNDGLVLPMAIDRRTYVCAAPREDNRIRAVSKAYPHAVEFEIDAHLPVIDDWGSLVRGVAAHFLREGRRITGADLLIASEVPVGAGLSSSAAFGIGVGYALLSVAGEMIDPVDLAETIQRAEQEYRGARCGIMDQYISCFGIAGHALLIDCRSLEYRAVPIPADRTRIVVCDTMVRHNLALGEYNARRAECEFGVELLASQRSEIASLRDATMSDLDAAQTLLPEHVYRRCRHVIAENERTDTAARALEAGNLEIFGQLMYESHASLRDDYEVSCRELDLLVEAARVCNGVYGARMTGGGFGGSVVAMVETAKVDAFSDYLRSRYTVECGVEPEIRVCSADGGVRGER